MQSSTLLFDPHLKLLHETRNGNRRAAEALVRAISPKLFGLAFKMLNNQNDAEEAVQEALLKLWKIAPNWQTGKAKIETWSYRVIYNLCIDKLRAGKKYLAEPLEGDDYVADGNSQEQDLIQSETSAAIINIIDKLPSRQKTAIILTYYQGLSAKEAGVIMDASIEAIESLLARAKRNLKEMIPTDIENDGILN